MEANVRQTSQLKRLIKNPRVHQIVRQIHFKIY